MIFGCKYMLPFLVISDGWCCLTCEGTTHSEQLRTNMFCSSRTRLCCDSCTLGMFRDSAGQYFVVYHLPPTAGLQTSSCNICLFEIPIISNWKSPGARQPHAVLHLVQLQLPKVSCADCIAELWTIILLLQYPMAFQWSTAFCGESLFARQENGFLVLHSEKKTPPEESWIIIAKWPGNDVASRTHFQSSVVI